VDQEPSTAWTPRPTGSRDARASGVATLFRRFPTRDDLVGAVFADKMHAYAAAIDQALADPWHGFCGYIERVCEATSSTRTCP
jgi:hypothetical protein